MEQFRHLLLRQPNSLVYKPALYLCEPIFGLINYNLALVLVGLFLSSAICSRSYPISFSMFQEGKEMAVALLFGLLYHVYYIMRQFCLQLLPA